MDAAEVWEEIRRMHREGVKNAEIADFMHANGLIGGNCSHARSQRARALMRKAGLPPRLSSSIRAAIKRQPQVALWIHKQHIRHVERALDAAWAARAKADRRIDKETRDLSALLVKYQEMAGANE